MVLWMFSAVVFLLTCSAPSAIAGKGPRTEIAPAYEIDLRSVIKADATPQLGMRETPWVPVITLDFLNNERLAATLVAPAKVTPGLATRGGPDAASPFRLRGVVIEASTARVLVTPEWPSNSRAAGVVAANDSGFVTDTGSDLTLFSLDLAQIKQMALPPCAAGSGNGREDNWHPNASWSGNRVLLVSGPVWSKGCWLWVDAESLEVLASWQDQRAGPVAVSDDHLIRKPFGRHFGDTPSSLEVAIPGGDWRPLPSTLNASAPQFVGPHLLYFQRYGGIGHEAQAGVFLMRTDTGEVCRLEPPRKGWGLGRAAVSRTGNRFVIPVTEVRGSHPALDIGGHSVLKGVFVYDPPFHAASYTLGIDDSKVRNASAALSPDGRHLAVLGYPEPLVEVFELPPTN